MGGFDMELDLRKSRVLDRISSEVTAPDIIFQINRFTDP